MARLGLAFSGWLRRNEAPTWALAGVIYGGWLALTFCWHAVPIWIGAPLGAWLCAWHMSLQHELIHGHPTRNAQINGFLAGPPLNLWLPYALYREAHLRHHRAAYLTDPLEDPESTYLSADAWHRAGVVHRYGHLACNTAIGRVLLGPVRSIAAFWAAQARLVWRDDAPWIVWLGHAAGLGVVLVWVCGVCRIGVFDYVACFVYPGTALILIRSLAEHRAAEAPGDRTAVVERAGLLGLLFLNNNLHVLHHERPWLPWYELPGEWRHAREYLLASRHGPIYRGYLDVVGRYAWRPHHPGPHPSSPRFGLESAQPFGADGASREVMPPACQPVG